MKKTFQTARLLFSFLILSTFVSGLLYYLFSIEYIDHVEPLIASVSWLAALGKPVYHSLDSAERYSNLYGPFLYLFTGGFLKFFGPSFFASKLGATLASSLSFVFFFFAFQTQKFQERLQLLGWLALIYLSFAGNLFWIRPEPWMLMFTSLAVLASTRFKPTFAMITWAVCAVVLVHLKLHAGIYALPSFALFYQRLGFKKTYSIAVLTALIMPLPFLLIPNLSFFNLMSLIAITSQHGIEVKDILVNLGWVAFYALPLLMSSEMKSFAQKNKLFLGTLGLTFILASISGALRGAGRYHLLPALPYYVWIGSSVFKNDLDSKSARVAFGFGFISILALIWNVQRTDINLYSELSRRNGEAFARELTEIQDQHPNDTIQMGFGHIYPPTFYRPLIVFRQNAILLDGATLMDLYLAKLEYTDATLEHLQHCQPSLWVFAKGDEPFDLRHVGNSETLVFRPEIRSIFLQHFTKVSSTEHYDLWSCTK